MSTDQVNQNGVATVAALSPTCMESVNRITRLPVVESTIQTATTLYEKVKEYNSVTNWTLSTAESTVNKAVEVGKPLATPMMKNFEGPIKKVDGVLCTGLDYVESKVPAVKLPPGEIYASTKDYMTNTVTPAVESARAYAEPAVKTAMDYAEPAVQSAKTAAEPTIQRVRNIVEPLMQPAMDTMNAVRENVMHRVDEYLHRGHVHEAEDEVAECEECQNVREQMENKSELVHHQ